MLIFLYLLCLNRHPVFLQGSGARRCLAVILGSSVEEDPGLGSVGPRCQDSKRLEGVTFSASQNLGGPSKVVEPAGVCGRKGSEP